MIPVPGRQYTVKVGDTLTGIAKIAYGRAEKAKDIYNANQTVLRSGDPDLIYPGEIINLPIDQDKLKATNDITGKDSNDFTVVINDIEIPVYEASLARPMDTCADSFTGVMLWNPEENKDIDNAIKQFADAKVYLGNTLQLTGMLYTIGRTLSNTGRFQKLAGYAATADIVDSTMKPPYEVLNYTIEQRAKELLSNFGINIEMLTDLGGKFDKMTANSKDTIFDHLRLYTTQRGGLISCDEVGNLVFQKANTDSQTVGTIAEGQPGTVAYNFLFDGRKRFNSYRAISQTPGSNDKVAVAKDNNVPKSRFITFNAPDTTKGDIQAAANWQRSKALADAYTQEFPVTGWYAPNGQLWQNNTVVTIVSPTMGIPDGFDFLIRNVVFNFTNSGISAILSIVPPQVYTGEEIPEIFI